MKTKQNGFTLIELILVIVILGILGAVAVPKFSGLQISATIKTEEAVLNQIKAGLANYASQKLIETGRWDYPIANAASMDLLATVLDEVPDGWTYDTNQFIEHVRDDSTVKWKYTDHPSVGSDRGTYTIDARNGSATDNPN